MISDSMSMYAAIQNGYQSGQFPARPFCLFGVPDCFQRSSCGQVSDVELGARRLSKLPASFLDGVATVNAVGGNKFRGDPPPGQSPNIRDCCAHNSTHNHAHSLGRDWQKSPFQHPG